MKISKKFIRKLRQRERKYYSRLRGYYRYKYSKYRNKKFGINENKNRIKRLSKKQKGKNFYEIVFPANFNIYNQEDSRAAIKCCNLLIDRYKYIYLDLLNIDLLSAAAAAFLVSNIYKSISMGKIIKCNYPKNKKSIAVLQKIGFFEAIGKPNPMSIDEMNSYPDVRCWYVYKGTTWDSKTIYNCVHEFTISFLSKNNDAKKISKTNIKKIEVNIKEIIGNTVEHAYPENYFYDKQWILFARYDYENNFLTIIISDSGKTIPITFVQYHKDNPDLQDRFKSAFINDDKLIKMAVQESGSGTREKGRGYGLKRVEESVQNFGGALMIYSRRGCYKSAGTTAYIFPINLQELITGTIVDIMLPIDSLM